MEEENGSGYYDNSDVGCLFRINVLFNDQNTEEKRRRIKKYIIKKRKEKKKKKKKKKIKK